MHNFIFQLGIALKALIVGVILCLWGLCLRPFEVGVYTKMSSLGLSSEALSENTKEALGQTSALVALGGLRSLVASSMNLQAFGYFEKQEWPNVIKTYKTIHILQPKIRYYWEAAINHAAFDAYLDYGGRWELTLGRRRSLQKKYMKEALGFVERALQNNPDDWRIWRMKAGILSNRHLKKDNDYALAAQAYQAGLQCSGVSPTMRRQYFYLLLRMPSREEEAWALIQELYKQPSARRFPSIRSGYYYLQLQQNLKNPLSIDTLFGNRYLALQNLFNYYQRANEGYPVQGLKPILESLAVELEIPEGLNPLKNTDIRRVSNDLVRKWITSTRSRDKRVRILAPSHLQFATALQID